METEAEDTTSIIFADHALEPVKEKISNGISTPHKRTNKLRPLTTGSAKFPKNGRRRNDKAPDKNNILLPNTTPRKTSRLTVTVGLLLLFFGAAHFYDLWDIASPYIPSDRLQFYEEQISTFVNDNLDETCSNPFNIVPFLEELDEKLIHQDEALLSIHHIMRNHSFTSSMALVGGSGTGKTLTTNLLRKQFQWPNNIQHIIWSSGWQPQHVLKRTLHRLGKCGHNLIMIDNISTSEQSQVAQLNRELTSVLLKQRIRAIVVYVFNIPTFLDEHLLQLSTTIEQLTSANNATGIPSAIFRPMSLAAVRLCVQQFCKESGIDALSNERVDLIVQTIDVERSGCKQVYAQLMINL